MKNKELLKGIVLVVLAAASYGVQTNLVALAYDKGFTTIEVTLSQFSIGLLVMGILVRVNPRARKPIDPKKHDKYAIPKLMMGGTMLSLTSIFYYFSVQTIPVSIGVVLLMQSIWMGVVVESIQEKKWPGARKLIAVIIVLAGTLLATNAIDNYNQLNIIGVLWGLAAAVVYTISIYTSSGIALHLHAQVRSFWNLVGATAVILIMLVVIWPTDFKLDVFWKWGIWLAISCTILPPLLFNIGLPKTGMGLGSILIAIEIPVSVTMAWWLLNEEVNGLQWIGVILILVSVILMNINTLRQERFLK